MAKDLDKIKKLIIEELDSMSTDSVDHICWDKGCRLALIKSLTDKPDS